MPNHFIKPSIQCQKSRNIRWWNVISLDYHLTTLVFTHYWNLAILEIQNGVPVLLYRLGYILYWVHHGYYCNVCVVSRTWALSVFGLWSGSLGGCFWWVCPPTPHSCEVYPLLPPVAGETPQTSHGVATKTHMRTHTPSQQFAHLKVNFTIVHDSTVLN